MNKVKTLVVAALVASALAIPTTAGASGGDGSCVGKSMQLTHTAISTEARTGTLHDLIESFRTSPEQWPWC